MPSSILPLVKNVLVICEVINVPAATEILNSLVISVHVDEFQSESSLSHADKESEDEQALRVQVSILSVVTVIAQALKPMGRPSPNKCNKPVMF